MAELKVDPLEGAKLVADLSKAQASIGYQNALTESVNLSNTIKARNEVLVGTLDRINRRNIAIGDAAVNKSRADYLTSNSGQMLMHKLNESVAENSLLNSYATLKQTEAQLENNKTQLELNTLENSEKIAKAKTAQKRASTIRGFRETYNNALQGYNVTGDSEALVTQIVTMANTDIAAFKEYAPEIEDTVRDLYNDGKIPSYVFQAAEKGLQPARRANHEVTHTRSKKAITQVNPADPNANAMDVQVKKEAAIIGINPNNSKLLQGKVLPDKSFVLMNMATGKETEPFSLEEVQSSDVLLNFYQSTVAGEPFKDFYSDTEYKAYQEKHLKQLSDDRKRFVNTIPRFSFFTNPLLPKGLSVPIDLGTTEEIKDSLEAEYYRDSTKRLSEVVDDPVLGEELALVSSVSFNDIQRKSSPFFKESKKEILDEILEYSATIGSDKFINSLYKLTPNDINRLVKISQSPTGSISEAEYNAAIDKSVNTVINRDTTGYYSSSALSPDIRDERISILREQIQDSTGFLNDSELAKEVVARIALNSDKLTLPQYSRLNTTTKKVLSDYKKQITSNKDYDILVPKERLVSDSLIDTGNLFDGIERNRQEAERTKDPTLITPDRASQKELDGLKIFRNIKDLYNRDTRQVDDYIPVTTIR